MKAYYKLCLRIRFHSIRDFCNQRLGIKWNTFSPAEAKICVKRYDIYPRITKITYVSLCVHSVGLCSGEITESINYRNDGGAVDI